MKCKLNGTNILFGKYLKMAYSMCMTCKCVTARLRKTYARTTTKRQEIIGGVNSNKAINSAGVVS